MAAKRLYEGMFMVDSAMATADWDGTLAVIENILKRADADVVAMRKWGERRLAYDIDHKSRGTYILCYFNAEGGRIGGIEKDVQLSEKVMRVLVLTTEKRPPEMVEQDIAGVPKEEPAAEFRDRDERGHGRERDEQRRPEDKSVEPRAEPSSEKSENEGGATQDAPTQVSDTQAGATQGGDTQVGDTQVRDTQVGDAQVGDTQVRDTQVGDAQVGDAQAGDTQVGDTHGEKAEE